MDRTPPPTVLQGLRREVNFGCPVPGCGEPFLSWHHFDPPWNVREHHEPGGMIALCVKHHKMADQGLFSPEQLRTFKQSPIDSNARCAKFEWLGTPLVIRLGGCYALDWCDLGIEGASVLSIGRGDDELLSTSFVLLDASDRVLAQMTENFFSFEGEILHDMSVSASGHHIKIWLAERKIGFECRYARLDIEALERMIQADEQATNSLVQKLPDAIRSDIMRQKEPIGDPVSFYEQLGAISSINEAAALGMRRRDPVGTILRWHAARHRGADGKIPVLDFLSCRLSHKGHTVELRNGRLGGVTFCCANRWLFQEKGFSMS